MIPAIQTIKQTRNFVLKLIDELTIDQLNKIPSGFSNNIAWNIGHLIAAQQGVCYRRTGLPLVVSDAFFDHYKPGSRPEGFVTEEELAQIKVMLPDTLDKLDEDHAAGLFKTYTPWTTRYGNEIASIESAIEFLTYHEGMHTGIIMAMKKLV